MLLAELNFIWPELKVAMGCMRRGMILSGLLEGRVPPESRWDSTVLEDRDDTRNSL